MGEKEEGRKNPFGFALHIRNRGQLAYASERVEVVPRVLKTVVKLENQNVAHRV